MHDDYISRATVYTWFLWAGAALTIGLVWLLALESAPIQYEVATALVAGLTIAAATVGQVRLYALRLCALLRITAGLESPDAELHHIG